MKPKPSLRKLAFGIVVGLVLQYILGMTANLFVQFPEGVREGKAWEFAWTQLPIAAHIIVGLGLFIGAVSLVIRSKLSNDRRWLIPSGLGILFIILAILGGSSFIATQNDLYSYFMSLSFIGAFLSYGWGIYQSRA